MNLYIGQKVWIAPQVQGRIVDIILDNFEVEVQEDHRIRVDGSKSNPIFQYHRNGSGEISKIHLNSLNL